MKLTTERILANIPCPILLSRGATRPFHRILVCKSGREPSLLSALLAQLGALFNQIDDVTVLHVMSQIAAAPGIAGWELRADAEELIEKQTPEGNLLEDELAQLDQVDVEPTAKIRHGLVVEEILTEAQSGDYDLVVIGAHPGEGWEHFLLDDLAKEIIIKVERPLLVMKR
jgi:nucleotide-binding universal stress UspA family protein